MSDPLQKHVKSLLQSYDELGGINHIQGGDFPAKSSIEALCIDLLKIIFPGFFSSEGEIDEVAMITGQRLIAIRDQLCTDIRKSVKASGVKLDSKSDEICCRVIGQLPEVRAILKTDVKAAYEGDPAASSYEEIILSYPCLEAIAIHRVAHLLYREGVPYIPRMMSEWTHGKTGIDIHPGAKIGSHFFIDHGTGVVIGETCVIGDHVKLYHGVTLGARSFAKDDEGNLVKGTKRHPNVENRVTIYPNATILGGETVIGESSTIGAGAFVMKSVPANALVVAEGTDYTVLDKLKRRDD